MIRAMTFAFSLFLLAACPSQSASQTMKPEPSKSAVLKGKALVDKVEVIVLEKDPPSYKFKVYGSLPDSCTSIDEVIVDRKNNAWTATITTTRPADKMCATVLVPFEKELADVKPEDGSSGTIEVNGVKKSFP
jgi:inhibitor of cysteine peptidase